MNAWVLRAVLLGALVVGLRTALGFAMGNWPTQGAWLRLLCLLVLVAAVVAWGVLDGRADRAREAETGAGADLTMRWLKAALAGGIGGGLVAWVLDLLPRFDLGDNGLLFELTAGAAFIVLLIFVPSLVGAALGRRIGGKREAAAVPAGHAPSPA